MEQPVPLSHLISPDITTTPFCDTLRFQNALIYTFPDPVPYLTAWDLQSRLHHERLLNRQPDTLLILEHSPVYTLGRRTRPSDWGGNKAALCENGTEFHHVNRGGSVTFHGPGQVVLYPILKLTRYATGAKQLVWLLEEVIIRVLGYWNITGVRIVGKPGVWIMLPQPKKISFVGIRIQQGVTLHGVSLNVDLDLAPFRRIHPCGFPDCSVTTMAAVSQKVVPVDAIKQQLAQTFTMVFSASAPRPVSTQGQEYTHAHPEGALCRNF